MGHPSNPVIHKPKIVFITTGYPSAYRPHECVFVHRSIKALSGLIRPVVIHFRALKPGRPVVESRTWDGVEVLSVSCPQLPLGSYAHLNTQLLEMFGLAPVREFLRSADLLHGAEIYPAGYVAGRWAEKFNKPFTFNVIGSDLNLFLVRNAARLGKRWLANFGGAVCNSLALKDDLARLMGGLPNARVIYRGVDTQTFSPEGSQSGPQAALPPVRFLYLGGFHSWDPRDGTYNLKGGHTLLEAWRMAEGRLGSASLAVGGPGAHPEPLRRWQGTLQNPRGVFCLNAIAPAEVSAYIRAADVVVLPSLSEGLPNLAKEAQACGRPVLGTRAGGIPEAVEDGQTGLLVPPGDPEALAGGLKWFCEHPEQIRAMGDRGRERMMRLFSWQQYQDQMMEFFQSALAANGQVKWAG